MDERKQRKRKEEEREGNVDEEHRNKWKERKGKSNVGQEKDVENDIRYNTEKEIVRMKESGNGEEGSFQERKKIKGRRRRKKWRINTEEER